MSLQRSTLTACIAAEISSGLIRVASSSRCLIASPGALGSASLSVTPTQLSIPGGMCTACALLSSRASAFCLSISPRLGPAHEISAVAPSTAKLFLIVDRIPLRSFRCVVEDDAFRFQLHADLVGAFEVLRFARRDPFRDLRFDLGRRDRQPRRAGELAPFDVLRRVFLPKTEHVAEVGEDLADLDEQAA